MRQARDDNVRKLELGQCGKKSPDGDSEEGVRHQGGVFKLTLKGYLSMAPFLVERHNRKKVEGDITGGCLLQPHLL